MLLATVSRLTQVSEDHPAFWGEYWRVTLGVARLLFGDIFGPQNVQVEARGNVLAVCGTLRGLVLNVVAAEKPERHDSRFPVLVTVRAVRRGAGGPQA